ncbi:unnamed protein product [Arctogadus glacialis]
METNARCGSEHSGGEEVEDEGWHLARSHGLGGRAQTGILVTRTPRGQTVAGCQQDHPAPGSSQAQHSGMTSDTGGEWGRVVGGLVNTGARGRADAPSRIVHRPSDGQEEVWDEGNPRGE